MSSITREAIQKIRKDFPQEPEPPRACHPPARPGDERRQRRRASSRDAIDHDAMQCAAHASSPRFSCLRRLSARWRPAREECRADVTAQHHSHIEEASAATLPPRPPLQLTTAFLLLPASEEDSVVPKRVPRAE